MRYFWGILTGVLGTILVTFIVLGIASLIKDCSIPQVIVDWFGNTAPVIEETVEQVAETVAKTPIA